MSSEKGNISMGTAALIAGLPLMLFTAPYGEFYVFGKLIVYKDAAQTAHNIATHPTLFVSGIFAMVLTFIWDIVLAWLLYIFMRPVNRWLSMLGAWLRIVYTGMAFVALFNFMYAYQVVNMPLVDDAYKHSQIWQLVNARRSAMDLSYIVFGIYLILGGVLSYMSTYVPKVLGILLMLAGASWIIISLKPYFFNDYNVSWLMLFTIGEVVFGFWLLFKGRKIKEEELT